MNTDRCAVLILAAGSSSRMGRPKQLLPWGKTTLLQNALESAKASHGDEIIVVLGSNSEIIEKTLPSDVVSVINTDWRNGMGSSISCGMHYLLKSKTKFNAVLVLLGDQPLIDSKYLNSMFSIFQSNEKEIVATDYKGRAGVPALFGGNYFKQLGQLNADFGAKELLAKNMVNIHLLKAGAKTADIDTETDYIKLNQYNK